MVQAEKSHVRDIFGFTRLKQRIYTSAQIDTAWTLPMLEDFVDWIGRDPAGESYRHLTWEEELEQARRKAEEK